MRILIVEDEKKVSNFIRQALEEERYAVDQAFDGEEGEDLARSYAYDLIILDLMLPKQDGLKTLEALRRRRLSAPILVLTAKDAVPDKVAVLDAGGDDYMTKPFSIDEFLARARALLRRGQPEKNGTLRHGDLSLNPSTREVFRGKRKIELTNKEHALLEYLLRNPGRVLTRSMIAEHVWNVDFDTESNVIDVFITYLRNKIDKGEAVRLIRTVRGSGSMLGE
jgi:two-component system copper resistance phosphate regulon response regulator CusR